MKGRPGSKPCLKAGVSVALGRVGQGIKNPGICGHKASPAWPGLATGGRGQNWPSLLRKKKSRPEWPGLHSPESGQGALRIN